MRAVGVDEIAAAAGTNKMTLYRHFASKDLLVAECLREFARQSEAEWDRLAAAYPGDPRAQLTAWLAKMTDHIVADGGRGCALANAAVELAEKDHPARKVIEEVKRAQRDRLVAAVRGGGADRAGIPRRRAVPAARRRARQRPERRRATARPPASCAWARRSSPRTRRGGETDSPGQLAAPGVLSLPVFGEGRVGSGRASLASLSQGRRRGQLLGDVKSSQARTPPCPPRRRGGIVGSAPHARFNGSSFAITFPRRHCEWHRRKDDGSGGAWLALKSGGIAAGGFQRFASRPWRCCCGPWRSPPGTPRRSRPGRGRSTISSIAPASGR